MIPFEIEFLQPETIDEALAAWREAADAGLRPRYFSGGTELVTGARERSEFDVLIDVKRIPECARLEVSAGYYGAATRLSTLSLLDDAPLVAAAARGVADRTVRNSITLGGNVCGRLPYREAIVPFLLFDASAVVAGEHGVRSEPLTALWKKRLTLADGELLVALEVDPGRVATRGFYRRRTRDARVDYPLVTLGMADVDGAIRFAVAGTYGYPVRSPEAEAALGAGGEASASRGSPWSSDAGARAGRSEPAAIRARAEAALDAIDDRLWDDLRGSAEYRRELLVLSLVEGLEVLAGGDARDGGSR